MPPSPSLFTLENVRYKDILRIDRLEIAAGVVTCIVGVSGSGKTTLLRHLNKMISPDSGQVLYRGTDLATVDSVQHRRSVVMLPQEPVMFGGSVAENLQIGRTFSGRAPVAASEWTQRLRDVRLSLDPDQTTDTLSGGEKQRIALARVMLMAPDVLLLDEPSSALDAETEAMIFEAVVADARARNTSVVMITHSAEAAHRWGDRRITLADGRVTAHEEVSR